MQDSTQIPIAKQIAVDVCRLWKPLAATDIAFKVLNLLVIAPMVALLLGILLFTSGNEIRSDLDLLFFCLGPTGWPFLLLTATLWLTTLAFELSLLLSILMVFRRNAHLSILAAIQFVGAKSLSIFLVTLRIVGRTLLTVTPGMLVIGMAYWFLLSKNDINFYLKEKPSEFWLAVTIAVVVVAIMALILLRLFSQWLFSLPMVLFENHPPATALRSSTDRAHGHRFRLVAWIAGWLLATILLSALVGAATGVLGHWLVPLAGDSIQMMVPFIGMTLLFWLAGSLAVNFISTIVFSSMLLNLYLKFGCEPDKLSVSTTGLASLDQMKGRIRVTKWRLLAVGLIGLGCAVAVGAWLLRHAESPDTVEVMAHRGASDEAPENTLAAIRNAIEQGADWVEIDVQETADGEVVVFHDSDFMRLGGNPMKIWDATLEDLKTIDIGSWFGPQFRNERVPTLAEVLDLCHGKIGINIELKYYGHDQQLEQRVADLVESRSMQDDIMLMSLKLEGVQKMKALRPAWKAGLLMSVAAGNLKQLNVDFLAVNASFATSALIRRAHQSGMEIYVWTVNDAPSMSVMTSRGVDGLLTDRPAIARSVLEQRATLSVTERLMLELAGILGVQPEIATQ